MKKRLFYSILVTGVISLFCQCDNNMFEDDLYHNSVKENFPEDIKDFGMAVSEELKQSIRNMHKMGIDYSGAKDSKEFRARFYEDYLKASPNAANVNVEDMTFTNLLTPEQFGNKLKNLTTIQLKFIERIIQESKNSASDEEYCNRLLKINEDIYAFVPTHQQERLLYITSVLYYSLKEIRSLELQGMMIPTAQNQILPILKTRSESGALSSSCRTFLATTWAIAVGEPTPIGEIVYFVALVYVGAQVLYEVTVCKNNSSNSEDIDCSKRYSDCIINGEHTQKECMECFTYCQGQHVWDCPRPK